MIGDLLAQLGYEHWLALGLVLLIAELMSGTTYLLWPAAAAGVTGLVALMARPGWQTELGVFALLVIVFTIVGRPLAKKLTLAEPARGLNERGAQLIGRRVQVTNFAQGAGAAKVGDTVWRIESEDSLQAGDEAEVLGVDGATLKVRKAG